MMKTARDRLFLTVISLLTVFGVFILPFFFPPSSTAIISVSNAAGFNNKVAAIAAALCAVAVFFGSRASWAGSLYGSGERQLDLRPLPWPAIGGIASLLGAMVAFAGWVVHGSHIRYLGDVGYFTHQVQSAAIYHRHLYTEIEFAYGPLLFYPTEWLYKLCAPWHLSLQACHFALLVMHQVLGVLLLGYLVNALPMGRSWKWFALIIFSLFALQPILGLNYTLLRFAIPTATLIFAARRKTPAGTAAVFGLGTALNLAISPEIGFAFAVGALVYASIQLWLVGREWVWAVLAIPAGLVVFLSFVGKPYLKMVALFAGGGLNFIVEPLPHILLFLLALVWFAPRLVAAYSKQRHQEAVLLGACLAVSLALAPVALGRADPCHVFFNGLGVFLLSMVAVSRLPRWQQTAWAVCLAVTMLAGLSRIYVFRQIDIGQAIRRTGHGYRNTLPVHFMLALLGRISRRAVDHFDAPQFASDPVFDEAALTKSVGRDAVVAPFEITLVAENALKRRGQYRPDFYCFTVNAFDEAAEDRKIREFNQARWAILPTGPPPIEADTQQVADDVLGLKLPYHAKRTPYKFGERFAANLVQDWQQVGTVNEYTIYRNKAVSAASGSN